jgi:hypothetical protein
VSCDVRTGQSSYGKAEVDRQAARDLPAPGALPSEVGKQEAVRGP